MINAILFVVISLIACTIVIGLLELFYKVIEDLHDRWLYNKGTCRDCGGIYKEYMSHDGCTLYECQKCNQMILIKDTNARMP